MFREELYWEKWSRSKVQGKIALERVLWASVVQGVIVQEGNYSGVIERLIQRTEVWRVTFLGRIL